MYVLYGELADPIPGKLPRGQLGLFLNAVEIGRVGFRWSGRGFGSQQELFSCYWNLALWEN